MWPLAGQVIVRLSGSFILLYTAFGLQVRFDGKHLVEVTVPSSYAGQLCGMCGELPGQRWGKWGQGWALQSGSGYPHISIRCPEGQLTNRLRTLGSKKE